MNQAAEKSDYLIAGLGNPGKKYHFTRHNIGFLSIDLLSACFDIPVEKKFKKSLIGSKYVDENNIMLMKPSTFMNLSGSVVLSAIARFKIHPENLLIIYDDVDLPLGKIRIKKKGASAGHRGLQSVIDHIQNDSFIRIRVGIGTEQRRDYSMEEFVLSEFSGDEVKVLKKGIKLIPQIVGTIIEHSAEKAMNDYN